MRKQYQMKETIKKKYSLDTFTVLLNEYQKTHNTDNPSGFYHWVLHLSRKKVTAFLVAARLSGIIADDGSLDKTGKILLTTVRVDANFFYYRKK